MEHQEKQPSGSNWISMLKAYHRHLWIWAGIGLVIIISLILGIDEKIIVFITILLGVFTQAFVGLGGLIAAVPFIGPIIIKVLTIPFFWLINALGYFVGAVAIKKGYTSEFTKTRILTLALLIGIIIGYMLGHIIPLR